MKALSMFVIFLTVTALLVYAAYESRGYWAVGGEWFWWLLPAMWWAARKDEQKEYRQNPKNEMEAKEE